jgi:hypothetical protein
VPLRLVYRSYGGENRKDRPAYYSKKLCLLNALQAADRAGIEVTFINNGPIAEELVALMRPRGEIVTLPDVGMRRSFLTGLRLPGSRGWPADDVVYFCEDDYLHVPDAFTALGAAASALDASYFALYGALLDDEDAAEGIIWDLEKQGSEVVLPRGFHRADPVEVDGVVWKHILSTTSTFGARVGALAKDIGIFRQSGLPHRTMYRDYDMCVTYQGYEAHPWPDLARELVLAGRGSVAERARRAALVPFKTAMNLRSHRRPGNRHRLVCAAPNLGCHMESAFLARGHDWERVARDTAERAGEPFPVG